MTAEERRALNESGEVMEPANVLVVDDEEYARHALRRLLKIIRGDGSFKIFEAAGGQDAMEVMGRVPVQCILLDIEMPGGDGIEWLPRMLELQPNTAVVMVTGVHDEERAVAAMKKGALDYLVKGSISPWSLQRAITGALDTVRMRVAMTKQREQLLIAERHRVMIESLGAACHHLGQPLTVVTYCLDILSRQRTSPSVDKLIADCAKAVEDTNDVLGKLRRVAAYRTEPYIGSDGDDVRVRERILTIDPLLSSDVLRVEGCAVGTPGKGGDADRKEA